MKTVEKSRKNRPLEGQSVNRGTKGLRSDDDKARRIGGRRPIFRRSTKPLDAVGQAHGDGSGNRRAVDLVDV